MRVQARLDKKELDRELRAAKHASHRAVIRSFERYGAFVEALAVQKVEVNTGQTRQGIHAEEVHYDATGNVSVRVVADSAWSIYLEMGFRGHFVPFHVSESLYTEARTKWGWRVPNPSQIHNPKPGRKYLIPRGRKSPTWGVFVKGTAKPFLRPALAELTNEVKLDILREELEREYRKLHTTSRS